MSRQKYPKSGGTRKIKQSDRGTPAQCDATGCTKPAVSVTSIKFTWFRGEDESVHHCDDHALRGGHDPKIVTAWCEQFPLESWK